MFETTEALRQVLVITGHICTGKSALARDLQSSYGYRILKTSEILREEANRRNLSTDRASFQSLGDALDKETGHRWVLNATLRCFEKSHTPIVVDNIRTWNQLENFRSQSELVVVHAHLWAPHNTLKQRFKQNAHKFCSSSSTYEDADIIKDESDIDSFKRDADVRVNTQRTDASDTLVRVAARIGLFPSPDVKAVDVIVGGQYGSEGKGHVAAYLARSYDVLLRVGGPNAGHTVLSHTGLHTYIHLPSGAKDTTAKLLLGPGIVIDPAVLMKEIEDCKISTNRLRIDPKATLIEPQDKSDEVRITDAISSTGQGTGRALARRINDRIPGAVRLARDVPELKPYLSPTLDELEEAYRQGASILLEGTQAYLKQPLWASS
jgi:adenylosuccinate synthase